MGASTEFRSIYRHGFARVAACTTRCTLADPAANAAAILEVAQACHRARRGAGGVPGTRPVGLRDQRPAAPVHAAGCGGGRRSRTWSPRRPICCRCCWSARRCAMPARCTTARWRSIAAGCSAWCRRCTCPTTANSTSRGISWRATGWWAARSPSAALTAPFGTDLLFAAEDVPGLVVHAEICEDIWIPVPPSSAGGAGRRDGARQPVGQQHHDRQGGDAAAAVRLAIGALRRGLSLRRGGCGRIHHRSRLGRPGLDLRERRDAGRDRALPVGQPVRRGRHRPRPAAPRAHADGQLRHQPPPPSRARSAASASGWIRRPAISAWSARSSAFRSCRPIRRGSSRTATRPTTSRSPGLAQRLRATGIKRVVIGVSGGLDSTQALIVCGRALDLLGLPRANILAYTMPGFATSAHTKAQRDPADGGARRHLAGARHPARGASAC